jgi:hypothetical protein
MADLTADFELGVNGSNILTTDPGSATAWDLITKVNGTGTAIALYDNAQAALGVLSGKFGGTGGTGRGYAEWSTALGTITDHYGRLYLYLTANPAATLSMIQFGQGATRGARIDITTAGKLAGFDNPAAALFTTFTNAIALNQWVRIEWHIIHSATIGQGEVKLFNNAASATPTETQTGPANKNTLANVTHAMFGVGVAGTAQNMAIWLDNIVANATAYPGPVGGAGTHPLLLLRGVG